PASGAGSAGSAEAACKLGSLTRSVSIVSRPSGVIRNAAGFDARATPPDRRPDRPIDSWRRPEVSVYLNQRICMNLGQYTDALALLADQNRMRLCALLRDKELCVTDLVKVTGIAQSRVSTHLGRLREAGFVRDRRNGPQSFYALESRSLPVAVRACLDEAVSSGDPTLEGDRKRLKELEAERRGGGPETVTDDLERDYSPGRTWQSLAGGIAALLQLGDVLDVGSG